MNPATVALQELQSDRWCQISFFEEDFMACTAISLNGTPLRPSLTPPPHCKVIHCVPAGTLKPIKYDIIPVKQAYIVRFLCEQISGRMHCGEMWGKFILDDCYPIYSILVNGNEKLEILDFHPELADDAKDWTPVSG